MFNLASRLASNERLSILGNVILIFRLHFWRLAFALAIHHTQKSSCEHSWRINRFYNDLYKAPWTMSTIIPSCSRLCPLFFMRTRLPGTLYSVLAIQVQQVIIEYSASTRSIDRNGSTLCSSKPHVTGNLCTFMRGTQITSYMLMSCPYYLLETFFGAELFRENAHRFFTPPCETELPIFFLFRA